MSTCVFVDGRCLKCGYQLPAKIKNASTVKRSCTVPESPSEYEIDLAQDRARDRELAETERLPGSQLEKLTKELKIGKPSSCNRCQTLKRRMNDLGIDGCKKNRDSLTSELQANAGKWGWTEFISNYTTAALSAVVTGNVFRLNPLDPYGSMIDEAIRRAEAIQVRHH